MVNIYTAVKITSERLSELVQLLKKGTISAASCIHFSYGRRLNALEPTEIYPLIDELLANYGNEGIWAALEITSMYQHNQKNNNAGLWLRMKSIITSKDLIGTVRDHARDAYVLEDIVRSIHENGGIDDDFARGLSKQIIVLCQVDNYVVFSRVSTAFRKIIEFVLEDRPIILWETLSSFFELATPQEIDDLKYLIGFAQFDAYKLTYSGGGLIFTDCLESEYLRWVRENPAARVPFLCLFYPLLKKNTEDDNYHWHSATQDIASEFGAISEFRDALSKCLRPSNYSDSIIPYFEKFLAPLKSWFQHPVGELADWSRQMHHRLEREIDRQIEREIDRQRRWENGD
jgi:chorismate mutase